MLPYIILSNHQSQFDILALVTVLGIRFRWVNKKEDHPMKFRLGKSGGTYRVLALSFVLIFAGCTLRLEDKKAPTFTGDLEFEYEVASWGRQKLGFAPSQPKIKASGDTIAGGGFRIRGCLSNTFTWTDPEGSLDYDFTLNGKDFKGGEPVKAHGWRYWGRLLLMPGLSLAEDRIFLAGLVGVDVMYMELEFESSDDTSMQGFGEFGRVGVPLGFHVEYTIARTVTPSITYAYIPNVSTWSLSFPGHDSMVELGLRIWPGSIIPALGHYLWIEGGWIWTSSKGVSSLGFARYEIDISGPYGGVGLRF